LFAHSHNNIGATKGVSNNVFLIPGSVFSFNDSIFHSIKDGIETIAPRAAQAKSSNDLDAGNIS
jgi:hypothetical protein